MILGRIEEAKKYRELLHGDVWRLAFDAIESLTELSPLGVRSIDYDRVYMDVHTYRTRSRELCVWESHRETIDLQYVIKGEEVVDYHSVEGLGPPLLYLNDRDRYEYGDKVGEASLLMTEGAWALFFPEDGHRPMVAPAREDEILKAVVKIPVAAVRHKSNGET